MLKIQELLDMVTPIFSMPTHRSVWDAYVIGYRDGKSDFMKDLKDFIDENRQHDEYGTMTMAAIELALEKELESDTITKEDGDE